MKLTELLNELATKCGKQNESATISLLSCFDLREVDVADNLAYTMIKKLLTVESAKKNSTLKKHFTALALAAADEEIMKGITKLDLGDDFAQQLIAEPNTYEKQRKLIARIREITELRKRKSDERLIELALKLKLSLLEYANPDISRERNVFLAKTVLDKELEGKAIIVCEGTELKLVNPDNLSMPYRDEHGSITTLDEFIYKVMCDHHLLADSARDTEKEM